MNTKWSNCNTNTAYHQTQHFNAIQQHATCFCSSETSLITLIIKVKRKRYIHNMQILILICACFGNRFMLKHSCYNIYLHCVLVPQTYEGSYRYPGTGSNTDFGPRPTAKIRLLSHNRTQTLAFLLDIIP